MELEQVLVKPKSQRDLRKHYTQYTIPWSAIIAGVIVSLGFQILLNFLGVALGMVILLNNNTATQKIVETSWLLISSGIAMCIGGWFVGAFSTISGTIKNACYGAVTWCIVALVAIFVTTNISNTFMGGQITLNDSPTAPVSYNLPTQRYISGIMPVTLDSSQTDEHASNELRKQEIKDIGKTSFILFCNFLVGLIASAMGAIIGDKFPISLKPKEKII